MIGECTLYMYYCDIYDTTYPHLYQNTYNMYRTTRSVTKVVVVLWCHAFDEGGESSVWSVWVSAANAMCTPYVLDYKYIVHVRMYR